MIRQITCPACGSSNCEISINIPKKEAKHLYASDVKKVHCRLCYDCGAWETSLELKEEG